MVRVQAKYERSLMVLKYLKDKGLKTKSGIMLGMGETEEEVLSTFDDLRKSGVEILTIGQYMQPTAKHLQVAEYVTPEKISLVQTRSYGKRLYLC